MGNHTAGHLINEYATLLDAQRQPGQSALDILDKAVARAKTSPGFSPDVEFESADPDHPDRVHPDFDQWTDPHQKAVLGMLLIEAFAPNGLADLPRYEPMLDADDPNEEMACDAWRDEICRPFTARYTLC